MRFKINEVVKLLDARPADGLANGAIGVIVAEFSVPEEAYEIEFCNDAGETIAQIALLPNQIALAI